MRSFNPNFLQSRNIRSLERGFYEQIPLWLRIELHPGRTANPAAGFVPHKPTRATRSESHAAAADASFSDACGLSRKGSSHGMQEAICSAALLARRQASAAAAHASGPKPRQTSRHSSTDSPTSIRSRLRSMLSCRSSGRVVSAPCSTLWQAPPGVHRPTPRRHLGLRLLTPSEVPRA